MRQAFLAPNGDTVMVDLPDPPAKRPVSEASRERGDAIRAYRKAFFAQHRRAPGAQELSGMLAERRRKK